MSTFDQETLIKMKEQLINHLNELNDINIVEYSKNTNRPILTIIDDAILHYIHRWFNCGNTIKFIPLRLKTKLLTKEYISKEIDNYTNFFIEILYTHLFNNITMLQNNNTYINQSTNQHELKIVVKYAEYIIQYLDFNKSFLKSHLYNLFDTITPMYIDKYLSKLLNDEIPELQLNINHDFIGKILFNSLTILFDKFFTRAFTERNSSNSKCDGLILDINNIEENPGLSITRNIVQTQLDEINLLIL